MRQNHGHTLLELLIALGLCAVLTASLYVTQFRTTRIVTEMQGADAGEAGGIQTRMHALTNELREATRLFFPVAGKAALPAESAGFNGLGFVDARGETILYYYEPDAQPDKPGKVFRVNVNRTKAGADAGAQVFFENVQHLRVNVPPAAAGKRPSLANLDIAFRFGDGTVEGPRVMNLIASVFLRSLERSSPDDPSHLVPPP